MGHSPPQRVGLFAANPAQSHCTKPSPGFPLQSLMQMAYTFAEWYNRDQVNNIFSIHSLISAI